MSFIYLFFWLTIFLNHVIRKPIILDCFSLVGFGACIEIGKSYILIQNLTMHGLFNIHINNERLFVCASVAVLSHCRSCPCPFSKQTSSLPPSSQKGGRTISRNTRGSYTSDQADFYGYIFCGTIHSYCFVTCIWGRLRAREFLKSELRAAGTLVSRVEEGGVRIQNTRERKGSCSLALQRGY